MKYVSIVAQSLLLTGSLAITAAMAAEESHSHAHAGESAHVHGVASLDASLDGNELVLIFRSPLADVVGFEHKPTTDAQRKQAGEAMAKLRDGARWLKPNEAAWCKLEDVDVDADALGESHEHEKLERTANDNQAKAHAAQKEGEHDHEHEGGHADVEARITFHCDKPAALTQVNVQLFQAFHTLDTINVQTAVGSKQSKQTLNAKNTLLNLTK